jgi:hypothetical protein
MAIEKCWTERSYKVTEVKYEVPKAITFDGENRETGGWP